MKSILRVRDGYINTDNGITICEKEKASKYSVAETHGFIQRIYQDKPMIGKITVETIK